MEDEVQTIDLTLSPSPSSPSSSVIIEASSESEFEEIERIPIVRGNHFTKSKSQQSRNKKQLKKLLAYAFNRAHEFGLRLTNQTIEFEESDERSDFKLVIKRKSTESPDILKNALKAKDRSYLSDNNYAIFRKETGLTKNLPSLKMIKSFRCEFNNFIEIFVSEKGKI